MSGDQGGVLKAVFADDYLYFHEPFLDGPRADRDAVVAASLIDATPGARVLDLCCGHGRLTRRLGAAGIAATGLDLSAPFIAAAQAAGGADYVRGDALALPFTDASFDGALCWFTSFGLQGDDALKRMLAEARRVLKPGARLAIDLANRDVVLQGFQHFNVLERDGETLTDRNEMDVVTGKLWITRTARRKGRTHQSRFFLRQFTAPEIADWMRGAGFSDIRFAGDDGHAFGPASAVMIAIGAA